MVESSTRPVLLFAFATEDSTIQVEEEARAIQTSLQPVSGQSGLCDVELPPFLKLPDIVDVFQKNRNRVSVFHYAGHANGSDLLLRTALGTGAGARGLSQIVRNHAGLKLVFLNGCSTERQADLWMAAGVPCVIATTQAVHGEVAKNFAARFYKGLATGASIRTSYDEAVGEATAACRGNTRLLYEEDEDSEVSAAVHGHWPWFMRTAPGAEWVEEWNLPDAAGDPLALLPLSSAGPLPDSPYPGLRRFTAADASLFFGRGKEVRRLYERVTSQDSPPVLLLHGQSGAGKSSILEAGLIPRLQQRSHGSDAWDVITIRLDPVRGIFDSLRLALVEDLCGDDGRPVSSAEAWRRREVRTGRPLLVVLDQLEEAFTHAVGPVPADWDLFVADLSGIFADRAMAPRGKIVLSFRTEWFSRIHSRLQGLWKSEIFLDCLDAAGIHEAIEGPVRNRKLREHYCLTIEKGVSLRVATELQMDAEASLAPTLQILMKKLWDEAKRISRSPTITEELHRRHRGTLVDFVRMQIQAVAGHRKLTAAAKQAVDAGLLLDFLECHVTPDLSSQHQTLAALVHGDSHTVPPCPPRYPGREQILLELRKLCIDHYLLVQPDSGANAEVELASRLAHDSLALHVRNIYQSSEAAGPRARRILEQRVLEKTQGVHDELDEASLRAIEEGESGMRALTPDEKEIVRRGKRRRVVRRLSVVAGLLIVLLVLVAFRWTQYAAELESVFRDPPERVAEGLAVARRYPWLSVARAHDVFEEGNGSRVDGEFSSRAASRSSLRAAMVLTDLDAAEQEHRRRILDEIGDIRTAVDYPEFQAIRQVMLNDRQNWSLWGDELADISATPGDPAVVAALLLSIGHPEEIPDAWYAPSADQENRTRIVSELSQWLSASEIDGMIVGLQEEKIGKQMPDVSRSILQSVLCLALAETSEAALREWWIQKTETESLDLALLENSPIASLHSAAKLLRLRLHEILQRTADADRSSLRSENPRVSGVKDRRGFRVTYPSGPEVQAEWAMAEIAGIGLEFVRIPAGLKRDGRTPVGPFWMSATEVPAVLFDRFRLDERVRLKNISGRPPAMADQEVAGGQLPASHVSWAEALNFCNWCGSSCRLPLLYSPSQDALAEFTYRPELSAKSWQMSIPRTGPVGFRLPTSDEWTFACSAEAITLYHFGDNHQMNGREILGRHAWFSENSWSRSSRGNNIQTVRFCGRKLPNAWGLFDMMGNVQEWCWTSDDASMQMLRSGDVKAERHECVTDDETPVPSSLLGSNFPGNGLRLVIDRWPE